MHRSFDYEAVECNSCEQSGWTADTSNLGRLRREEKFLVEDEKTRLRAGKNHAMMANILRKFRRGGM